jgi:phosphate transport system protein
MTKHFHRDMEFLHREILALSALVEEMIDHAARALRERDTELARQVIEMDGLVDQREVQIEDTCLKMLALHQPVAVDLRRIATVLKVNGDLERIADLAVNVAERASALAQCPGFSVPADLERIVQRSTEMVHGAMDAFVNLDTKAARAICDSDDDVDRLNAEIIDELYEIMKNDPQSIKPALLCFSATRHIERIADHATNIAEDVIYLVEGDIIRHRKSEVPAGRAGAATRNH